MAANTTVLVYDLKTQKIYRIESANVLKHHVIVQDTSGQTTPTGDVILSNLSTEKEDNADESNPFFDNIKAGVEGGFQNNLESIDENTFKDNVKAGIDYYNSRLENKEEKEEKPPLDKSELKKSRLKKYGIKKQGGILRYPAELLTEHTDYLQIDIEKYEAIGSNYITSTGSSGRYVIGNAKQNRAGGTSSTKLTKKPLINAGTILLPMPSNIEDSNNVVYGDSSLNGLAAAGVSVVETGMTSLGEAIAGTGKVDFTDLKDNISNKLTVGLGGGDKEIAMATAGDVITKKLVSEAVNIFGGNVTTQQLLTRDTGEILNPNMELLFSDVTIRNFRFNFKLTPRNPKEAEQVKLIIRAFKRNMAPQAQGGVQGAGNFFLRSPNVFKIRYRSGNRDHPFLNKFKQCFLTGVQTTYTGEGVYSTYDDRTPVSIILDLSFKEIQPIYDIDYDTRPGNRAVGY